MAMAIVELTLLGGFEARHADGRAIELTGSRVRALLAFLALQPGVPHSRDKLADLLWGDRGDSQTRDSLKHALTRLRQCLGPASPSPVVADRQSVRLDPTAVACDVTLFEQCLAAETSEALDQAIGLYRGDLLEGIGVRDAAFEDWLLVERQRLRQRCEQALTTRLARAMAEGAREAAAVAARRLLALDPLREAATRALMQIDAERSEAAQALKLYEALRDRLHRELGVKPEAQTTQLYESIRQRRNAPPHIEAPAAPGPAELPLPAKPSIAVLPFQNLSGDPEQEYFADGMVEEIITALSRFSQLFVIARNSSFSYKGRAIDAKQVGRELGVRYLLEGSVRKAGNRLRIMGQLIDCASAVHLWAERFEGAFEDVFDLQDQVTESVVGALVPKLEQAEMERARRKPTLNLDAYDYYLRGLSAVHLWTREGNDEALRMFGKAIELDPGFAPAYGMAARCYSQRKAGGWVTDRARDIAEVDRLARRAAELGAYDAVALATAGIGLAYVVDDTDGGAAMIDRALDLNSNLAMAWLFSGWVRAWQGNPDVAIQHVAQAMRLSPQDPQAAMMHGATACAHFFAGRIAEALSWAERSLRLQPNYFMAAAILAASTAITERHADADKAVARLRQVDPSLRLGNLAESFSIKRQDDFARLKEGLRKAGLPE
jgi:TolB-like protein